MRSTPASERLRVTHCSDIHLDGERSNADHFYAGFERVLAAARAAESDVLIIAGDLFDTNRVPSETVDWAMRTLAAEPFPVVMIPGNHDCMAPGGIYERFDFDALPNVEMLCNPDGEVRVLRDLQLAVWGKGMADHTASYRPIDGTPPRPPGALWYIGLGHGIYVPDGEETTRSSPVHARAIAESPCDYLALGHHHAALEVHAPGTAAAYCGSPTDTIGVGATFAVVDFVLAGSPSVQIRRLDPFV